MSGCSLILCLYLTLLGKKSARAGKGCREKICNTDRADTFTGAKAVVPRGKSCRAMA